MQLGQSDGVLKFQPRAATSEEDLASLVAAISDAKGGPPAPEAAPGGGGDAEADDALAASAAHTAGPSLVAKRRKASQAASKNMEVLAKLKEEKEALTRLRAPSVAEAGGPAGPAPAKPQKPAEGSRFRVMRQELKDTKVLLEAKQDEIEALKADLVAARQHAADLQVSPGPARARAGCRPDARGRLTRRSLLSALPLFPSPTPSGPTPTTTRRRSTRPWRRPRRRCSARRRPTGS